MEDLITRVAETWWDLVHKDERIAPIQPLRDQPDYQGNFLDILHEKNVPDEDKDEVAI